MNVENWFYSDFGLILYLFPILAAFLAAIFHAVSPVLTGNKGSFPQWMLAVSLWTISLALSIYLYCDRYVYSEHEIIRIVDILLVLFAAVAVLFYFTALLHPEKLTPGFIAKHCISSAILVIYSMIMFNRFEYVPVTSWPVLFENILRPTVIVRLLSVIYLGIYIGYVIHHVTAVYKNRLSHSSGRKSILASVVVFMVLGALVYIYILSDSLLVKCLFCMIAFFAIVGIYILEYKNILLYVRHRGIAEKSGRTIKGLSEEIDMHTSAGRLNAHKKILLDYFENQKAYLNRELTLMDIAALLGTNRTYASNLINKEFGMSFYQFVNKYRIEHAVEILENEDFQRSTIDSIPHQSGFKSKSVFYKQFKELKGCSPSDYLHYIRKRKNKRDIYTHFAFENQGIMQGYLVTLKSPKH